MTLDELNALPEAGARDEFERCCGSARWAQAMTRARPFRDRHAIEEAASRLWEGLSKDDWLEAFQHHPRIGDVNALRAKFTATADWAKGEQSGVKQASEASLHALSQGNADYEKKFGFIFLICATGKSAEEMLASLRARMPHTVDEELRIAAGEQLKITNLRLGKLLQSV